MKRRQFIQAGAVSTFSILPSGLWANSPNSKLRSAHIGVNGKGKSDTAEIARHDQVEVAAICDVDSKSLAASQKKYPGARAFRDYRELLSSMGDTIDIVTVSTPDHTHAPATMMAMNLGKSVYCQKPLTHSVFEAYQLSKKAKETGVSTQMGIQVQSSLEYRWAVALIQSGTIGKVKRVHSWSNKSWGYDGPAYTKTDPVPEQLDWDLWLGTAKTRPYVKGAYHPGNWRRQVDFGCGTMGDMGVHILDPPMLSLGLSAPVAMRAQCRAPNGIGHPTKNAIEFEFATTQYTAGPLTLVWSDGQVPKHEDLRLPKGEKLPNQGSMFVGEQGRMLLPHVAGPQFLPEDKFGHVKFPKLPRADHYAAWVDCHLGKPDVACTADFEYASQLTQSVLLGVVACNFPGKQLRWDAATMRVTNEPAANDLLKNSYRDGFSVDGLS
ncbi:MAG: putative dehydrogenase [Rhodothermales bacterium]|jgi:predicted dehydrogenase